MAADRDPHRLDAMEVRRAFERAATTYDDAAVLQREIGARMAERLGFVKLDVSMILDAGCGTGIALGELAARYPDASVFGVDLAYAMTRAAQKRCASGFPFVLNRLRHRCLQHTSPEWMSAYPIRAC